MSRSSFLEQAAEFLAAADADEATFAAAREAFIDYIGVALAGSQEQVARTVFGWAAARSSGREASVIGSRDRLDSEHAALCNGVAGHALDFDDTSWTTIGHPTTVVAPAALAIGESIEASGREVVVAYLAGVEVAHRLADLTMPEASQNGWHTTGIFYALGAAAAACRLLHLERHVTINALALSLSRASGIRANFGTQAKPYHAGMAARNGLEAVSLARAGLTAATEAVEGADGFIRCFAGAAQHERARLERLEFGRPYDLVQRGLAYKRYPCCSGSHPACDLLLDIVSKHGIDPEQVAEIRVGTSLLAERELVCHEPRTPVEARFSMEFALAVILVRGEVTLESFTADILADPMVRQMMARVRMTVSPRLAALGFVGTAPVEMEILLRDGRRITGSRDLAIGNPECPMSEADRQRKFLACAGRSITPGAAADLYQQLLKIDGIASVARLAALMHA
ncbi:MmgE/PrpD family protein [Methylobacterium planeticum]|uniref:MmgE/PrpD family protein n=1 Tax=Methylobacterium planeticum TaxID=2615211 RepID=A0A6N6MHJ9_9HYPH|nr:MmgE/PrpD family protein [Methylobacterium planeticum]KAB1068931.1 MmgE/PrpD family protein [Methylobacterium planeticum]